MELQLFNLSSERKGAAAERLHYVIDMLGELEKLVPSEVGSLLPKLISVAQLEAVGAADALTAARRRSVDTDTAEAA